MWEGIEFSEGAEGAKLFRSGRGILVMQDPKTGVKALIKENGEKLRLFEMSEKIFVDTVVEATKGKGITGIYPLKPLGVVWALRKRQMERWVELVKDYDVKNWIDQDPAI